VISTSVRPSGSSLGTIRLGAQDDKIWFGWKVGIPSAASKRLAGLIYEDRDDKPKAEAAYRKALALVPGNQTIIDSLKRIGVEP